MGDTRYIGIDVAKQRLDIAIQPTGEGWGVDNDEAGINSLVARLKELAPSLVVLEATGGLQLPVVAALAETGVPVTVVNPRQVRDFAKAIGKLAKTDSLDARTLALFAERVRPEPRPLPDAEIQALSALLARRRQVVTMLTAEKNRLGTAIPSLRSRIQAHITYLIKELSELDGEAG